MASNQATEPLCLRPSVLLSERLYLNLGDSDVTTHNQGGFGAVIVATIPSDISNSKKFGCLHSLLFN